MDINLYIFNQTRRGAIFGVGTYIRELAIALKKSNINVCIINLLSEKRRIQIEYVDGIKYWHFPLAIYDNRTTSSDEQWNTYYRNIVYLLQLHIVDRNNLIFQLNFFESGKLAEELKSAFNCKVIAVSHFFDWGFVIYDNPKRLSSILGKEKQDDLGKRLKIAFEREKSYYSRMDHVICLSNYMADILFLYYEVKKTSISVIPNGLSYVKLHTIEKNILRRKWAIPIDERIILFAGRLDEVKGVIYLIKAFRKLLKKYENCRLILVGSGDYDKCFQESRGVCSKITFTGLLAKHDLYELYQLADIGVIPSLFEPFGYVAVEMMMYGLPLVVTSTSGLNEVVNDACGIKIPISVQSDSVVIDTDLLSEKIYYLLTHPIEAKLKGQNAHKRYLENYTSKIFRKNMLKLYESCFRNNENKIKVLIVTGQSNHNWRVSHVALKQILENSGLFLVDIAISPVSGRIMSNFKPNFSSYQLVVLDYCGDRWPIETEKSFMNFVDNGGGVVVYHASNNAFREWKEYNQIIGIGGWGGRDETDGPYLYLKEGQLVYDRISSGCAGSHGKQHEFILCCGNSNHPITKGLPTKWLHVRDEFYDHMRAQGIVKDVLYWGNSDSLMNGSGLDEIAIFTVDYGNARIFHTILGHVGNSLDDNISMQCTGFQVTLLRGAEWAATGKVTQPVPDDFPTETTISLRKNYKYE